MKRLDFSLRSSPMKRKKIGHKGYATVAAGSELSISLRGGNKYGPGQAWLVATAFLNTHALRVVLESSRATGTEGSPLAVRAISAGNRLENGDMTRT